MTHIYTVLAILYSLMQGDNYYFFLIPKFNLFFSYQVDLYLQKLLMSLCSVVIFFFFSGSLCAELYFLASKPIELPDPTTTFLSKTDFVQANKYILGLTAEAPITWASDGDIFGRPRALVVG